FDTLCGLRELLLQLIHQGLYALDFALQCLRLSLIQYVVVRVARDMRHIHQFILALARALRLAAAFIRAVLGWWEGLRLRLAGGPRSSLIGCRLIWNFEFPTGMNDVRVTDDRVEPLQLTRCGRMLLSDCTQGIAALNGVDLGIRHFPCP